MLTRCVFGISTESGEPTDKAAPRSAPSALSPGGTRRGSSEACFFLSGDAPDPTFPLSGSFLEWGISTPKHREDKGKKELPELEAWMGPEFY